MSTTPPEQPGATTPPGAATTSRSDFTPPIGMGFFPGNAELVVWILALLVAALVCWIADTLGSGDWMSFFLWTTAAYLISRGVAKASRVYEV